MDGCYRRGCPTLARLALARRVNCFSGAAAWPTQAAIDSEPCSKLPDS